MTVKEIVIIALCYTLLCSTTFLLGTAYENKKWAKQGCANLNDFYADSTWKYQNEHKIELPEELSTLSWYDDKRIDLLYGFIDDGGTIHFGFVGKTMPQDSLHLIH